MRSDVCIRGVSDLNDSTSVGCTWLLPAEVLLPLLGWPIALSCAPLQHIRGGGESVNEPHVGCIQRILEHLETQLACYHIPLLILLHELAILHRDVKKYQIRILLIAPSRGSNSLFTV